MFLAEPKYLNKDFFHLFNCLWGFTGIPKEISGTEIWQCSSVSTSVIGRIEKKQNLNYFLDTKNGSAVKLKINIGCC
jgi:hypothetical protein